jgi:glycosyltransferase involved in cell wall biosynthesis
MKIWIINPYGSLPDEDWRTYRSTMIANALGSKGHEVLQFISNFEHRSKSFREEEYSVRTYNPLYSAHIIPCEAYSGHISLERIKYERSFAKNLISFTKNIEKPDLIILAEPALFYYDILLKWFTDDLKAKFIVDLIDIWPELFHLLLPNKLDRLAKILLSPLYFWRKRLYRKADGVIAVSQNYLDIALSMKKFEKGTYDVVYWSIPEAEIKKTHVLNDERIEKLIGSKGEREVWCIYAGTLGENYDIYSIIEVGKMLKMKYSTFEFKLLVAGDGPLTDFCKKNSKDESIIFLGRLSSDNLAELFKSCDFALSTYKDRSTVSMPIKAFDYFAFGLPLINSLGRDLGMFIKNNSVGINYIPQSVDSLYDAMKVLIDDTEKRDWMKQNALKLSKHFSEGEQYAKFVSIVENVVRVNENITNNDK